VKETVAEKIRLERLKLNLSQQNMADELGLTVAAYSNLERGVTEISVNRLTVIAGILKKSPQWFFDSENTSQLASEPSDSYQPNHSLSNQVYRLIQEVQLLRSRLDLLESRVQK
jgi:transcriptional regulator with XRE-family HTH domain